MNIKALIKKYEELWNEHSPFYEPVPYTSMVELFLKELKQLDESEIGHADEAPRYVKNILARLRELPLHDREVWLKAIMSEFEQDFSHAKWREGYEQGKIEGMVEREKVVVPLNLMFGIGLLSGMRLKNQKIESLIIGLITPEKILFKPSSTCTTSATRSKKRSGIW